MLILKNAVISRIIVILVIFCFAGCVTSKIEYVEEKKLPRDKVYHISMVYLKDGTTIDLYGKEPVMKQKYKGKSNVIVYNENVNIEKYILLSDVAWMKIVVVESNVVVTAIAIIGITAAILFIALLVVLGTGGLQMH